jgi:hypothetical protein
MKKLFRKRNYFIIYKIENITEATALDKQIMFFVKRFFRNRFRKVKYFEPFTDKGQMITYLIFGSCLPKKNGNKLALAFLLEAYASMKNSEMYISTDFPLRERTINKQVVKIYKVK